MKRAMVLGAGGEVCFRRGGPYPKAGVTPRWPGEQTGMEKPKRAQRRKPDTAKADLKPVARNIPEGRVSGAIRNPKGMRRSIGLQSMGATPKTNRSAKDGARLSPHYGGEGVSHSPIAPSRPRRSEAEGPLTGGQGLLTHELGACVGARSSQPGNWRHGWNQYRGF